MVIPFSLGAILLDKSATLEVAYIVVTRVIMGGHLPGVVVPQSDIIWGDRRERLYSQNQAVVVVELFSS